MDIRLNCLPDLKSQLVPVNLKSSNMKKFNLHCEPDFGGLDNLSTKKPGFVSAKFTVLHVIDIIGGGKRYLVRLYIH